MHDLPFELDWWLWPAATVDHPVQPNSEGRDLRTEAAPLRPIDTSLFCTDTG